MAPVWSINQLPWQLSVLLNNRGESVHSLANDFLSYQELLVLFWSTTIRAVMLVHNTVYNPLLIKWMPTLMTLCTEVLSPSMLTSCSECTLPFGVIARTDRATGSIHCSLPLVPFLPLYLVSFEIFSFFYFVSFGLSLCSLSLSGSPLSSGESFWAANELSRIVKCVCTAGRQMTAEYNIYWPLLSHLIYWLTLSCCPLYSHKKYVTFFGGSIAHAVSAVRQGAKKWTHWGSTVVNCAIVSKARGQWCLQRVSRSIWRE